VETLTKIKRQVRRPESLLCVIRLDSGDFGACKLKTEKDDVAVDGKYLIAVEPHRDGPVLPHTGAAFGERGCLLCQLEMPLMLQAAKEHDCVGITVWRQYKRQPLKVVDTIYVA
jgi:hypothetical protein